MTYQLPPDLDAQIRQHLSTGHYRTEEDVLREALLALKCQEAEVTAIGEGIDDMEAGNVQPLREFDREFRKRKGMP